MIIRKCLPYQYHFEYYIINTYKQENKNTHTQQLHLPEFENINMFNPNELWSLNKSSQHKSIFSIHINWSSGQSFTGHSLYADWPALMYRNTT